MTEEKKDPAKGQSWPEPNFPQGPWRVVKEGRDTLVVGPHHVHEDDDAQYIALVYQSVVPGRFEATARLIAAAPEQYAVLQQILDDYHEYGGIRLSTIEEVGAAIAKAEGRG